MKLYIKNMVCDRCKMAVKYELVRLGLKPIRVDLGEVETEDELTETQYQKFVSALQGYGFEIIDKSNSRIIEKVKSVIIELIHRSDETIKINYSVHIESKLKKKYNYLSNLFSEIEGITIEQFIIYQKIEKVKELLVYDELSLSEIADKLGYSSVAYLSTQFKKTTGLTPSYFKSIKDKKRLSLDNLKPVNNIKPIRQNITRKK
ncbi:MAG TPA: helix-turn-helix transcriptional regulator [Chitinophagales bacterium]|nr:helix-turn-helix transcriptional regulator [Chitinophagales bacterium]